MPAKGYRANSTNTCLKNLDKQTVAANIGIPPGSDSPFAGLPWKRTMGRSGLRANRERGAPSGPHSRFGINPGRTIRGRNSRLSSSGLGSARTVVGLGWLFLEFMVTYPLSKKRGLTFVRRAPDNVTEELLAVLSSRASYEFKALFEIIFRNLRKRNAASGGEDMLRLRVYEKLQSLVSQGAVTRTPTGVIKKYRGVAARLLVLKAEMKVLRADWKKRTLAKAALA